eukprot:TRINITY_DN1833_c0_g1_i1.p2 TRINITY_DN1833_c0_g1~~TRINITY_DN1833_c0_g1_i1.p2  ORF type:complete len:101 (+),score=33.51 TRINITY_DN1833_c0_g1_i1:811-1113(+)
MHNLRKGTTAARSSDDDSTDGGGGGSGGGSSSSSRSSLHSTRGSAASTRLQNINAGTLCMHTLLNACLSYATSNYCSVRLLDGNLRVAHLQTYAEPGHGA